MVSGRIIQTYQGLNASYQIIAQDGTSTFASIPYNSSMGSVFCEMPDGHSYSLKFDFRNGCSNWGKEIQKREYALYRIEDTQGRKAGTICQKRTKGFFSGYAYHEVILDGRKFHIYCVALGKEGKKYPVYLVRDDGEEQVGQIHKPCAVENMRDLFEYRVLEEEYAAPIVLYILYGDLLYHGNRGQIPIKSVEVTYEVTVNKKLKEKYHSDF